MREKGEGRGVRYEGGEVRDEGGGVRDKGEENEGRSVGMRRRGEG